MIWYKPYASDFEPQGKRSYTVYTRPYGPWAQHASRTGGTVIFPQVKRTESDVNPLSVWIKNE
jgi:hypothetical protein